MKKDIIIDLCDDLSWIFNEPFSAYYNSVNLYTRIYCADLYVDIADSIMDVDYTYLLSHIVEKIIEQKESK